jgi:hypothetical protein
MYNTSDVVLKKSNTKPEIYSDFRQKPDAESRCVFPKGSLDPASATELSDCWGLRYMVNVGDLLRV